MGEQLQRPGPTIVGRKHEQDRLGALLDNVAQGNGTLALISGEAGIGKTTLVRDLIYQGEERGWIVLQGGCYDLTVTPPYGPWIEVTGSYDITADGLPEIPDQLRYQDGIAEIRSQTVLFELFHDFFVRISSQIPLLIVVEDLHWSDPASLELLRFLSRNCSGHPILVLATYRDDELSSEHDMSAILPSLVRESQPERLHLGPLDRASIRAFISDRYELQPDDLHRLVDHLADRADGNPFFTSEILQGLEEAQLLWPTDSGWRLGDLDSARVPPLLRQIIDVRLARIRPATHSALQVAAVIGQEIRVGIWSAVSGLTEIELDAVLPEALNALLIEETPGRTALQFRHALLREALYESLTLNHRRDLHRRVGEALADQPSAEPDHVAHHYQQARDPRAKEWLLRAGEYAQRSFAWLTAAERFAQALTWVGDGSEHASERGWLLYRTGSLLRHSNHRRAHFYLERAYQLAIIHEDAVLTAYALWNLGRVRWLSGDMRRGLAEMADGEELLRKLPADHASPGSPIVRSIAENLPVSETLQMPDIEIDAASTVRGTRVGFAAHTGHIASARQLGQDYLHQVATIQKPSGLLIGSIGDASFGLGTAEAISGRPEKSRQWFERALRAYRSVNHHFMITLMSRFILYEVGVTYDAANLITRRRLVEEFDNALQQSAGVHPTDLPESFGKLPILLLEGEWIETRQVAAIASGQDLDPATSDMVHALYAETVYCQGDPNIAEDQIRTILPEGPMTEPGDCYFLAGLHLQRVACSIALDQNELDTARAWAKAHDRWLAWNGAILGQADGHLLWARYHQLNGNREAAQVHAETSLRQASNPRQPRTMLVANRFLGALATHKRRFSESAEHLAQALDLAQQCQAPFERALTLLELVELRLKQGRLQQARLSLNEAQEICLPLEAAPALAYIDVLARRIEASAGVYPDGLTPREVDVLRLIAAGKSNREMAEHLFLSVRTIERHVANIYTKIDAHNRNEAVAYADRHGLSST